MTGQKTIKCSQCNRLFANRAALQQHMRDRHSGGGKRQPSGGGAAYVPSSSRTVNSLSGGITITRSEALSDLTTDATNGVARNVIKLKPNGTDFVWLKKMYDAFSEAEYLSFALFWKPAVSANTDGRIAFCFDSDGQSNVPGSRADVLGHSPSMDAQIWKDTQQTTLRIPLVLLRSRLRWPTAGDDYPGSILYYATGPKSTMLGELWVSYSVRFYGPR